MGIKGSFRPALKCAWGISGTSLAFLDIEVSIGGNGLCAGVRCRPTGSRGYLLHSSSHPFHVKNSIPYSQFLGLRRLCSVGSDFSSKSEEMCQFFEKRGCPASVIQAARRRAQQINRQSALQTSQGRRVAEFHSPSHFILAVAQLKLSSLTALRYSKMILKLVQFFRNHRWFRSGAAGA